MLACDERGGSATTKAELQPTYDAAGNIQTLTTSAPGGGPETQAFCYDSSERLIWASTIGTGPCGLAGTSGIINAGYTASYTYDVLGRLTAASVLNSAGANLGGAAQGSYTYDPTHVHGVASVGSGVSGYAASYDAAGNMTCRALAATSCGSGNQQLTYDPLGRLLTWQNAATSPTASEQYAYDGAGQRVWQQATSTSGGTTITTSITYVLGVEEVTTTSVSGQQPTTSTTSSYALAGGLSATRDSSGLVMQMSDLVGTPIVAFNLASGLVDGQLRTPYGQARFSGTPSTGSGMHTTFGFTGQREDTQAPGSSGLDYFNARSYDPVVGRFTSADPTRPDLGRPQGTDAYGYVRGQVENATDPSGELPTPPQGWLPYIGWVIVNLLGFIRPTPRGGNWEFPNGTTTITRSAPAPARPEIKAADSPAIQANPANPQIRACPQTCYMLEDGTPRTD